MMWAVDYFNRKAQSLKAFIKYFKEYATEKASIIFWAIYVDVKKFEIY